MSNCIVIYLGEKILDMDVCHSREAAEQIIKSQKEKNGPEVWGEWHMGYGHSQVVG